jgi:MerR family transcriptional regulator, light-induced transcriptional regulator
VSQALYRIGTLARLSGLSTHAIRVWERRYGAASPQRAPGGARLYTEMDLQRFQLISRLLQRGYSTRAIANLDLAQLSELANPEHEPPSELPAAGEQSRPARAVIDSLLDAIRGMDVELAERVLARASNELSPRELVVRVVAPALEEIGTRWASGDLCTASEHAASALLRTRLGALLSAQPVGKAPPVVCTTPSGEPHELGALLVAVLIAMSGRRAIFLGADLPAQQIAEAVRMSGARGVAISVVVLAAEDAQRELTILSELLPHDVDLVVGGRGAVALTRLPARIRVLGSVAALEAWMAE